MIKKIITLIICTTLIASQLAMAAPSYATDAGGMNAGPSIGMGGGMSAMPGMGIGMGGGMSAGPSIGMGMGMGGGMNEGLIPIPAPVPENPYNGNDEYVLYKSADEVESITDEQLIKEVSGRPKFLLSSFYNPDEFNLLMAEGETWHEIMLNSASTVDDATKIVKSFALMQTPLSYNISYIGENNYLYAFRLAYKASSNQLTYKLRIVVYKDKAKFCSFNPNYGYNLVIRALDKKSVTELLDLEVYFQHYRFLTSKVLYTEIKETGNEYIYVYYTAYNNMGDWFVKDRATLTKTEIRISKTDGSRQVTKDTIKYA